MLLWQYPGFKWVDRRTLYEFATICKSNTSDHQVNSQGSAIVSSMLKKGSNFSSTDDIELYEFLMFYEEVFSEFPNVDGFELEHLRQYLEKMSRKRANPFKSKLGLHYGLFQASRNWNLQCADE